MYHPATKNTMIIYHLESEQVLMIIKDASDINDPRCHYVNDDPEGHAVMHLHPDEYNQMDHEALQAHHRKYIPIHKSWYQSKGHHLRHDQASAALGFRKHLAQIAL